MKILLIMLAIVLLPVAAHATAQIGDNLIYKGEKVTIFSTPLESYFDKEGPLQRNVFGEMACSACWRGYVATWEIKDGYLYLKQLHEGSCEENPKEIPLSKIFRGQKPPIKATWFSGTIRIPRGKQLRYVHMGFGSIYEKEEVLTFKDGKLTGETLMDNTKTKLPSVWEQEEKELQKLKKQEEKRRKAK